MFRKTYVFNKFQAQHTRFKSPSTHFLRVLLQLPRLQLAMLDKG